MRAATDDRPTRRAARAILALCLSLCGCAAIPAASRDVAPPRLLVLVSIDQFPRSYIDRFGHLFGQHGFRRLLDGGADFSRCTHGHAATWTGPGHAVLLTGAHPQENGIIGNRWFSRSAGRTVGCVEDDRFPIVGAAPGGELAKSGVSPHFLRSAALGDSLRGDSQQRAKVISIAGKDRASVLMGGRRPNAAYWFDQESCGFVSSSYYFERLPEWAHAFNATRPCDEYIGGMWDRLLSAADYAAVSGPDDASYEMDVFGLGRVFPHPIVKWNPHDGVVPRRVVEPYRAVGSSPFGNDLVLSFARAAVRAEQLGVDDTTDLLAIGLSSNDYVGHYYGPNSQEVADMTVRTDVALGELMSFLDTEIGAGKWSLVVTSDHGVASIPEYLLANSLLPDASASYRFHPREARAEIETRLREQFFAADEAPPDFRGVIAAWSSSTHPFVYLREGAAAAVGAASAEHLATAVARAIETLPGVAKAYTFAERQQLAASQDPLAQRVIRAWDRENGGDLEVVVSPHWVVSSYSVGTNHGTPYEYDTHVPLFLYGAGIRPGTFTREVSAVDIAPSLAKLIGVSTPPSSQGSLLREALR